MSMTPETPERGQIDTEGMLWQNKLVRHNMVVPAIAAARGLSASGLAPFKVYEGGTKGMRAEIILVTKPELEGLFDGVLGIIESVQGLILRGAERPFFYGTIDQNLENLAKKIGEAAKLEFEKDKVSL